MRASASPVGSVESTSRCRTWGLIRLTRPLRVAAEAAVLTGEPHRLSEANPLDVALVDLHDSFHAVAVPEFKNPFVSGPLTHPGDHPQHRSIDGGTEFRVHQVGMDPLQLRPSLLQLALQLEKILLTAVEFIDGDGTRRREAAVAGQFPALDLQAARRLAIRVCSRSLSALCPGVVSKRASSCPADTFSPSRTSSSVMRGLPPMAVIGAARILMSPAGSSLPSADTASGGAGGRAVSELGWGAPPGRKAVLEAQNDQGSPPRNDQSEEPGTGGSSKRSSSM